MLVTGMSGTGKSTVLAELRRRGHEVHEGDDGWIEAGPGGRRWRVAAVRELLATHRSGPVFLAGCEANQAALSDALTAIALLAAPAEVITERVANRANPYGSSAADRATILRDLAEVEPLLRRTATRAIDARRPIVEVADDVEWLAAGRLWRPATPGLLRLPSGRLVRGRSWRHPYDDRDRPTLTVRLSSRSPRIDKTDVESRWVPWPDFGPPRDPDRAREVLTEAWVRADAERVEVCCRGGRGRTGTALAALLVLDGMRALEAIATVRRDYVRGAVETTAQRRFLERLADRDS